MKVIVVPHDPDWARAFQRESEALAEVLGSTLIKAHHVGSTAIPGIHAKPVIDLMLEVDRLDPLDAQSADVVALGYEAMGEYGIPGRRYFRKEVEPGIRTHHVHAFCVGDPQIERHLLFRDFMRAHSEHAQEYSRLKQRLAAQFAEDFDAYMDGKDGFIKEIDRLAAAWHTRRTHDETDAEDRDV